MLGVALPYPIYANPTERIRGIANEPAYYTWPYVECGGHKAPWPAVSWPTPLRAMFEGGMCMLGYYSGLPYLAEMTGLTQYSLAKMPLAARGAIGHEKVADAVSPQEARRIYEVLQRYYLDTAGPEKKSLADALWRQVQARESP